MQSRDINGNLERSNQIAMRYYNVENLDGEFSKTIKSNEDVGEAILNEYNDYVNREYKDRQKPVLDMLKINNKLSPVEYMLTRFSLYDANQSIKDFEKLGRTKKNPIEFEIADHRYAHAEAVMKISKRFKETEINKIAELSKTNKDLAIRAAKDLDEAILFTRKMIEVFDNKLKTVEDLLNEFYVPWTKLSDIQKMWSTLYFMSGLDRRDQQHGNTRRFQNLHRLLPTHLMSKTFMKEYSDYYYNALNSRTIRDIGKGDVKYPTNEFMDSKYFNGSPMGALEILITEGKRCG